MAVVFITPLTHTEFGQILDAYYAKDGSIYKIFRQLKEKANTFEQKISSLSLSIDKTWQQEGVRWVKNDALNGRSLAVSHLEGEFTEFELPEELADHIKKKRPVLITQWW